MKRSFCMIGNFLSRYGHTPQMCEFLYSKFIDEGHNIIRGGAYRNPALRLLHMLYCLFRHRGRYRFIILETFSGKAFFWAYWNGLLARWLKKPYVAVLRGGNLPEFSKQHHLAVQSYLKHSAAVVSPSPYLKEWCQSLAGSARIIENPIEIQNYTYKVRETFRPRLLWVRRFHSIYNPQMAIRVFHEIHGEFSESCLVMAGPDSGELEPCRQMVRKLGLFESVKFTGLLSKPEIDSLGGKCDFFINTSNIDNTPFSLIEAAAMGLPIISTNPGGIPFLFENEKSALLVKPNDYQSMALEIRRALHFPEATTARIQRARRIVAGFDWVRIQPKWEQLFGELNESLAR